MPDSICATRVRGSLHCLVNGSAVEPSNARDGERLWRLHLPATSYMRPDCVPEYLRVGCPRPSGALQNDIGCSTRSSISFWISMISIRTPPRVFHHRSGSKLE